MAIDHIRDREQILSALREELLGPAPAGKPIDCSRPIELGKEEGYGPYRQAGTGEEILLRDRPTNRYGLGVLFPKGILASQEEEIPAATAVADDPAREVISETAQKEILAIEDREERGTRGMSAPDSEEDAFSLSDANSFRPSSMAVSFLVHLSENATLKLRASGGRYRKLKIRVDGRDRVWWLRLPVSIEGEIDGKVALKQSSGKLRVSKPIITNGEDLSVGFEVYSRTQRAPDQRLITVCLVNRTPPADQDSGSLFQVEFQATVKSNTANDGVLPYPSAPISQLDEEEQGLELLYRYMQTFAVGHGCAAEWLPPKKGKTETVMAVPLPVFETPSTTPDITDSAGHQIDVPMQVLCSQDRAGPDALRAVVGEYRAWIAAREEEVRTLHNAFQPAALRHINECLHCADEMERGLEFLQENPHARTAFRLANQAILWQQLNAGRESRRISWGVGGQRQFAQAFTAPDLDSPRARTPRWRAFQIAFLLMSIRPAVIADDKERETVDLIWFPTGGGKTEAYLALAAFTAFFRRLQNPADIGVGVLMRYTLRLLTTQQFQRAGRLICAMEVIRRNTSASLGTTPFSIGIWLGGETTPNRRVDAVAMLRKLLSGDRYADNGFLLDRCPWCRAEIGVLKEPNSRVKVLGYEQQGGTVAFTCSDPDCEFQDGLPVYVIDEDIYDKRPTLIIGTVDKFAALAWRPEARAIFGLASDGSRSTSPPGLIIQDELHMISGPLGSVVGLYEVLVEELCTDRRTPHFVRPKIVCSTATIRRYQAQVRSLYNRSAVRLFPPPGLEAGDSFFARYARGPDGALERGRAYVGVYAPGLGSIQTAQVRSFAAVLAAPLPLEPDARDPWWTLLVFFNSLRELGGTVSLLQSDVPDYLRTIRNRTGSGDLRYLNHVLELTSRLTREEVPEALNQLEVTTSIEGAYPVDVCLASSIIEVGVDIDRLSLMAIVGQPKTTAQYIQVSGRVGRQWKERPGVVVTVYGATKARDRSHYEKFRSYHEKLYAQVEPTSVTPFSRPVIMRALHAVMAGFVRQQGTQQQAESPNPCPRWMLDTLEAIMSERVNSVDPEELDTFVEIFARRTREWERWQPRYWGGRLGEGEIPLLRRAGEYTPDGSAERSWSTLSSMRSVDAECQAEITNLNP